MGLLAGLAMFGSAAAIVAASSVYHIHGRIVSIDPHRATFMIHHQPFAGMPMAMTMEVEPKNHADLKRLRVGETIDATIDMAVVPWPATDIRPAGSSGKR